MKKEKDVNCDETQVLATYIYSEVQLEGAELIYSVDSIALTV